VPLEEERMETTRSADGTTIAFERCGAGPPVLLVGGALCDRAANRPVAEELSRRGLTGVTYDRRGRGDSGAGGVPQVSREIEDIAAIVGLLDQPTALYGHSSGAALALRAVTDGVPVSHLVLHEAPYNPDEAEARKLSASYRHELDRLLADGRAAEAAALFVRTVGTPAEAVEAMRSEPWWAEIVAVAPTLAHDSEAMGDLEGASVPIELLHRVPVPTLVLYGDRSPPWMLQVAEQLATGITDGRLEILEGQEHVVAPEVLAPVLERFLRIAADHRSAGR
jgi:pimeloyl-ACP methyl ester carboxylesterase